jgi:transposase
MSRSSKLLDKQVVNCAKQGLKELGKVGLVARKLQAIVSAEKHGITAVAEINGISRTTLTQWIKQLKGGELVALEPKPKRPRSSVISAEQAKIIHGWIEFNSNITIRELQLKIESEFAIKPGKSTVHRLMQKIFAYITPRPKHYKQDQTQAIEFKKKSTRQN